MNDATTRAMCSAMEAVFGQTEPSDWLVQRDGAIIQDSETGAVWRVDRWGDKWDRIEVSAGPIELECEVDEVKGLEWTAKQLQAMLDVYGSAP